jgi:TPR repeat protein
MFNMASYYFPRAQAHESLPPGEEPDAQIAFQWTIKAAEHGEPRAQLNLGGIYSGQAGNLVPGIELDYPKAAKWFQAAAEQDNAVSTEAQFALAKMLYMGKPGVEKDILASIAWLRKAGLQKYPPALDMLKRSPFAKAGVSAQDLLLENWMGVLIEKVQAAERVGESVKSL